MQKSQTSVLILVLSVVVVCSWLAGAGGQSPSAMPALRTSTGGSPAVMQVFGQPGEPISTVVYDPEQQVLGVYHIDRQTGAIELKSIRQIQWDLKMLHFQGKAPLPQDIKNGLESASAG